MSTPKHLWSGEWQQDSADAARQRASRRLAVTARPQPDRPAAPERPPPERPPRVRRARRRVRVPRIARPSRAAVLAGLGLLIAVVAAAVAINSLGGSSAGSPASHSAYLGVQLESIPVGQVLISGVVPGSPADRAGLAPGDVISAVDNRPVSFPGDVTNLVSRLHPGDRVAIRVQRGPLSLTTAVTLTAQGSSP